LRSAGTRPLRRSTESTRRLPRRRRRPSPRPGINSPSWTDPRSGSTIPHFFIAEIDYDYNQDQPAGLVGDPNQEGTQAARGERRVAGRGSAVWDLPGTVKLGAWFHTGQFGDQRFNAQGGLRGVQGGEPLQHTGNFAVYGVIDQMLWRGARGDDRELDFFLRASGTPGDRNLIDLYVDTGLTFKGLLASRPEDTLGLGFAFARISPQASASERDLQAFTGMPMPIQNYEAVIELTYQMRLNKSWSLQPDLQYIIHPGGNIPNPLDASGTAPIPNAFVKGMRTILRF
jgi:porin